MILLEKSYWEIRKTKSMGRGVFATKEIPPGTIIGDYLGEVVDPSEDTSDEFGMYNLWINFETMVYADPNTEGLHLLNHSCAPNISMFPYKGHMLFFSLRKIFPREQLTLNYRINSPPHSETVLLHPCYCKNRFCRGTQHNTDTEEALWGEFLEREFSKTKQLKLPVGTIIKPLINYPTSIPDDPIHDLFGSSKRKPLRIADKNISNIPKLRELIRTSGKQLYFSNLSLIILAIKSNVLIAEGK
jgi:hypothetical protein